MPTSIIAADELDRGTRVVGFARVSEAGQVSKGSLRRQQQILLTGIRERGFLLRNIVAEQERGKLNEPRPHLLRAIEAARRHRAGIVAVNLSRLIRPSAFDKVENWTAVPTAEELELLFALSDGVLFLATLEPPESLPSEVHSRAIKRGQAAAGNRGGRPSVVPYNVANKVLEDINSKELPYREIANRHKVSLSAVKRLAQKGFH